LHYRWPDFPSLRIESRMADKLAATAAFSRVNSIDRHVIESANATVGIVTCGKSHYDLMEVLRRLEITPQALATMGVRLYKVGLSFPIETTRLQEFAQGLSEILVIEEKGAVVETQMRDLFYNAPAGARPAIVGEFTSGETIKRCVETGTAIGVLALISVTTELDTGRLIALPWNGPTLTLSSYLIAHQQRCISPAHAALRETTYRSYSRDCPYRGVPARSD